MIERVRAPSRSSIWCIANHASFLKCEHHRLTPRRSKKSKTTPVADRSELGGSGRDGGVPAASAQIRSIRPDPRQLWFFVLTLKWSRGRLPMTFHTYSH